MFHLNAGIHFDEKPRLRIKVIQKLDSPRVIVTDLLCDSHGGVTKLTANSVVQPHGRRDLHHFLVTPLHRTIAFVEMQDLPVAVAEYLHLNVLRPWNVFLQKYR